VREVRKKPNELSGRALARSVRSFADTEDEPRAVIVAGCPVEFGAVGEQKCTSCNGAMPW